MQFDNFIRNNTHMNFKLYSFLFILLLPPIVSNANGNLQIINSRNLSSQGGGNIFDMEVKITPVGFFAQVELTFRIGATSLMGYDTDPLEAIMNFDLPYNSYLYDSWLWLNDSTIISAAIVEKDKALDTYNGIVSRTRDPSLIYKVGENKYQLHVYPLFNKVSRKIKIAYRVPLSINAGKAYVSFPMDLLRMSKTMPAIDFTMYTNGQYTNPDVEGITVAPTAVSADSMMFRAKSNLYSYTGNFNLYYETSSDDKSLLINYPTGANEGYYQLYLPPLMPKANRYVTLILDHPPKSGHYDYEAETFADIKAILKSHLMAEYSETDSFNIFFTHNNTITQADSSWLPMNDYTIITALNAIPSTISSDRQSLKSLIAKGYKFSKTRPHGTSILMSKGVDYYSDSVATTIFEDISDSISGYTNKIHVINYSGLSISTPSGGVNYGNQNLLYKFVNATGGLYIHLTSKYYNTITRRMYVEFDINHALNRISANSIHQTNIFSIDLPLNGINSSEYNLYGYKNYNPQYSYVATGRYHGSLNTQDSVILKYIDNNGLQTIKKKIDLAFVGDSIVKQSWVSLYLSDIENRGVSYFIEALDSSINNRVLCDYTAFLAIETGDTLKSPVNPHIVLGLSNKIFLEDDVKVYPNPFSSKVTIATGSSITNVEVYDFSGRLLSVHRCDEGSEITIDLRDLPIGIYVLKVQLDDGVVSRKIQKVH